MSAQQEKPLIGTALGQQKYFVFQVWFLLYIKDKVAADAAGTQGHATTLANASA
jgi:hypothetical protein